MEQEPHRLDYGGIIATSLRIVETEWRILLALAAIIVGLPSLIFTDTLFGANVFYHAAFRQIVPSSLVLMAAQLLLVAAVVPIAERQLQTRLTAPELPVADIAPVALPAARRALPTAIVIGVIIGIGYKLFILPGLILTVIWFCAVPAALRRGHGITAAMEDSAVLTRGHRWDLFGLLVVVWLLTALTTWFLGLVFGVIGAESLGRALATIAVAAFMAVLATVVYEALDPPAGPADAQPTD